MSTDPMPPTNATERRSTSPGLSAFVNAPSGYNCADVQLKMLYVLHDHMCWMESLITRFVLDSDQNNDDDDDDDSENEAEDTNDDDDDDDDDTTINREESDSRDGDGSVRDRRRRRCRRAQATRERQADGAQLRQEIARMVRDEVKKELSPWQFQYQRMRGRDSDDDASSSDGQYTGERSVVIERGV